MSAAGREHQRPVATRPESSLQRGFDLLATAPNAIASLRELVLGAALRGILDATSGPYTPTTVTSPTRRPALLNEFPLPRGWHWSRVGELCDLRTGATPSTSRREFFGGDVRWLVSGDIHQREIHDCEGRITSLAVTSSNCKVLPENSVLIALNGQGKTRATVAVLRVPAACNQSLVAMTPKSGALITPEFLFWNLRYRYREIRDVTGQHQRRGLNMGLVSELSVAVAPLAEQHRIVARVEELMKLCDALEQSGRLADEQHARLTSTLFDALAASESAHALAENWRRVSELFDLLLDRREAIDALEQSILELAVRGLLVPQHSFDQPANELLASIRAEKEPTPNGRRISREPLSQVVGEKTQPFDLPTGWEWARFPEVGEFGRGKSKHRPRNDPSLFDPGIYPLIQTGEVSRAGKFITEVHSYYSEVGLAQSRLWPAGTLCITIAANIADSAILSFDACFPDSVVGFIPARRFEDARYFLIFMKTARQRLVDFAPATAQKNINLDVLNSVLIPLPPAAEQRRIVSRVEELQRLCADLRRRLTQARTTQAQLADALVAEVA